MTAWVLCEWVDVDDDDHVGLPRVLEVPAVPRRGEVLDLGEELGAWRVVGVAHRVRTQIDQVAGVGSVVRLARDSGAADAVGHLRAVLESLDNLGDGDGLVALDDGRALTAAHDFLNARGLR